MILRTILDEVLPILQAQSDERASVPRASGKWSAKELVGHLIDSAANNHQRLVRGQFSDELGIMDYEQDSWVRVQIYQERTWMELLELWAAYNRHLAHVIEVMPQDVRLRIWEPSPWWQVLSPEIPRNLDSLIHRYEVHFVHHLGQVFEALHLNPPPSISAP